MIRSIRPEVKSENILGWSVYYDDGRVFRRRNCLLVSKLPRTGCQGIVVFCRGDPDLGQSPTKVYREIDCGAAADVVFYVLPGMKKKIRASMIDDDAFEVIRQRMDQDWEF